MAYDDTLDLSQQDDGSYGLDSLAPMAAPVNDPRILQAMNLQSLGYGQNGVRGLQYSPQTAQTQLYSHAATAPAHSGLGVLANFLGGAGVAQQARQDQQKQQQTQNQWAQHTQDFRKESAQVLSEHETSGLPISHSIKVATQKAADAFSQGDNRTGKAWTAVASFLTNQDKQSGDSGGSKELKSAQDALEGFDKLNPNLDPGANPDLAAQREYLAKDYSDKILALKKTKSGATPSLDDANSFKQLQPGEQPLSITPDGAAQHPDTPESNKLSNVLATSAGPVDESTGRREAWLNSLPSSYGMGRFKDLIKGIADYDMNAQTRYGGMQQGQAAILDAVKKYDPSFDMKEYPARAKAMMNLTSGDDHKKVVNLNTVGKHLGDAVEVVQGLGNSNFTPQNFITNWFKNITGETGPVDYATAKNFLDNEVTNYLSQNQGTDAERRVLQDIVNVNGGPKQLITNLYRAANMVHGKADVLINDYANTFGSAKRGDKIYQRFADKILQSDTRASFDRLKAMHDNLSSTPHAGQAPKVTPEQRAAFNAAMAGGASVEDARKKAGF